MFLFFSFHLARSFQLKSREVKSRLHLNYWSLWLLLLLPFATRSWLVVFICIPDVNQWNFGEQGEEYLSNNLTTRGFNNLAFWKFFSLSLSLNWIELNSLLEIRFFHSIFIPAIVAHRQIHAVALSLSFLFCFRALLRLINYSLSEINLDSKWLKIKEINNS